MKKLFLALVALILFITGCGRMGSSAPQGGFDQNSAPSNPLVQTLNEIRIDKNTTTTIKLDISSGDQSVIATKILVELNQTDYSLTYDRDERVVLSGALDGSNIKTQLSTALEERLTPPCAPGETPPISQDLLQALTLLNDANELFVLNDTTVRGYEVIDGTDNTLTYVIDLYEGEVKRALPILAEQFKQIADVTGLSLKIKSSGTKTEILLELKVVFVGETIESTINCHVEHTKVVKVID